MARCASFLFLLLALCFSFARSTMSPAMPLILLRHSDAPKLEASSAVPSIAPSAAQARSTAADMAAAAATAAAAGANSGSGSMQQLRRKEINRLAARRSRIKRTAMVGELRKRSSELVTTNMALKSERQSLVDELSRLETIVELHKRQGCRVNAISG